MDPTPGATLHLIDASAPFFLDEEAGKTNWSKIDFRELEQDGKVKKRTRREVLARFEAYVQTVRGLGYDALSLDDLAHVVKFRFYPKELKRKLKGYRKLYRDLLAICTTHGMRVFLNTDLMFHLSGFDAVERAGDSTTSQVIAHLCRGLERTFERYPEVEGVVFRLGESDGIDVSSEFKSRLMIVDPEFGNRVLRRLLVLFRRHQRIMIVRTWTVGAYRVGDLMWNRETFERLFRGLSDPLFYVSMKYGEADFFKYLELNPLFFEGPMQKLVELQARREYEGFGSFPSYVGFDYERLRDRLRGAPGLRGVMVWCQTGGWSHFRGTTFLQRSSLWNELNTYACARLFRDGWSAEEAVRGFCSDLRPGLDPVDLLNLVRGADRAIERLWYLPGYSRQTLFFRRVRIPPRLWVFWDTIFVNHTLRKVLRRLVPGREAAIAEGYAELERLRALLPTAERLGLDEDERALWHDTLELLAVARDYFLAEDHRPAAEHLALLAARYAERHPNGFRIELSFSPWNVRRTWLKLAFRVFLRRRARYRLVDRAFLNLLTRVVYPLAHRLHLQRRLPELATDQAMGIGVIFR